MYSERDIQIMKQAALEAGARFVILEDNESYLNVTGEPTEENERKYPIGGSSYLRGPNGEYIQIVVNSHNEHTAFWEKFKELVIAQLQTEFDQKRAEFDEWIEKHPIEAKYREAQEFIKKRESEDTVNIPPPPEIEEQVAQAIADVERLQGSINKAVLDEASNISVELDAAELKLDAARDHEHLRRKQLVAIYRLVKKYRLG